MIIHTESKWLKARYITNEQKHETKNGTKIKDKKLVQIRAF